MPGIALSHTDEEIMRHQFETAMIKAVPELASGHHDISPFKLRSGTSLYVDHAIDMAWLSWKLAKGYK